MRQHQGIDEIPLRQAKEYIHLLKPFIATSLMGALPTQTGTLEIIFDPIKYSHIGKPSPRSKFYMFEELYSGKNVFYVVTSQCYPLAYLDKWGDWHYIGETKNKISQKHIQELSDINFSKTKFEETLQVLSLNQTENEDLRISAQSAVGLVLMDYEEDDKEIFVF